MLCQLLYLIILILLHLPNLYIGKNLFRRAIIHSGSALSTWAISTDPLVYVRQLADAVNCTGRIQSTLPSTGTEQLPVSGPLTSDEYHSRLVKCFKTVPARVLTDVEFTGVPRYRTAFGPNIDRRMVLPSDVRTLVGKQSDAVFGSTALMIGVTRNEGQIFFGQHELDEVPRPSRHSSKQSLN
jgi:Carboxylesterase family